MVSIIMRVAIAILVSCALCSCASHTPDLDTSAYPLNRVMSADNLTWIADADASPMDWTDPTWISNADANRLAVNLLFSKGYTNAKCSGMSIGSQFDYFYFEINGENLITAQVDRKSKKAKLFSRKLNKSMHNTPT